MRWCTDAALSSPTHSSCSVVPLRQWGLEGSRHAPGQGVVGTLLLRQRFQQCSGLPEVSGIKALGEAAIDLRQYLPGFLAPSLQLA